MNIYDNLVVAKRQALRELDDFFLANYRGKVQSNREHLRIAVLLYYICVFSPALFLNLVILAFFLFLFRPLGTYHLPVLQAEAFWLVVMVFAFLLSSLVAIGVCFLYSKSIFSWRSAWIIVVTLNSTLLTGLIVTMSWLFFGPGEVLVGEVIFSTSLIIGILFFYGMFLNHPEISYTIWAQQRTVPPIIYELPMEYRGQLISISAKNHHIRITTNAGTFVVRKNFSEALELTANIDGQKIHRSHWVATKQIEEIVSKNQQFFVRLKNGHELPIAANKVKGTVELTGRLAQVER